VTIEGRTGEENGRALTEYTIKMVSRIIILVIDLIALLSL
jgi:hypothetical protein